MQKSDGEDAKDWQREIALRVGREVQRLRQQAGMSVARLAELTGEVGYPIHRVTLGKIESGNREGKLDIAELMTLAVALQVPPVMLLFPGLSDRDTWTLPGVHSTAWEGLRWFTGEQKYLGGPPAVVSSNNEPVAMLRDQHALSEQWLAVMGSAALLSKRYDWSSRSDAGDDVRESSGYFVRHLEAQLEGMRAEMERTGVTPNIDPLHMGEGRDE